MTVRELIDRLHAIGDGEVAIDAADHDLVVTAADGTVTAIAVGRVVA